MCTGRTSACAYYGSCEGGMLLSTGLIEIEKLIVHEVDDIEALRS